LLSNENDALASLPNNPAAHVALATVYDVHLTSGIRPAKLAYTWL